MTGGSIMVEIGASGRPPIVKGPAAPALADDTDPWSWHQIDALPVHSDPKLTTPEQLFADKYSNGTFVSDGRHVWLRIIPEKITSWDFRKMV